MSEQKIPASPPKPGESSPQFSGESTAWSDEYIQYFYHLTRKILPRVNHDENLAEEISEKAMTILMRKLNERTYDPLMPIQGFLVTTAKHLILDHRRKHERQIDTEINDLSRRELLSMDWFGNYFRRDRDDELRRIFFFETVDWIMKNIPLSTAQSEIFLANVISGMGPKEIEEEFGYEKGKVRKKLYYIRKKIQKQIAEFLSPEDLLE